MNDVIIIKAKETYFLGISINLLNTINNYNSDEIGIIICDEYADDSWGYRDYTDYLIDACNQLCIEREKYRFREIYFLELEQSLVNFKVKVINIINALISEVEYENNKEQTTYKLI